MKKYRKSEAQWRQHLTAEQYRVCRQRGTEAPFSGEHAATHQEGIYSCVCCGEPLFSSEHKFDSGTGWPSYFQPISDDALESQIDSSHGMERTEIHCAACGSHLGHVFADGPLPTGLRYCINSLSLHFEPSA